MAGDENVCGLDGKVESVPEFPRRKEVFEVFVEERRLGIGVEAGRLEAKEVEKRLAEGAGNAGDFVVEGVRAGIETYGDTVEGKVAKRLEKSVGNVNAVGVEVAEHSLFDDSAADGQKRGMKRWLTAGNKDVHAAKAGELVDDGCPIGFGQLAKRGLFRRNVAIAVTAARVAPIGEFKTRGPEMASAATGFLGAGGDIGRWPACTPRVSA